MDVRQVGDVVGVTGIGGEEGLGGGYENYLKIYGWVPNLLRFI